MLHFHTCSVEERESVCLLMSILVVTPPDQEAEDEAAEGSVSEQAATKQAPKKRPPKKTVEQNLSNINLSESEMKCEVKDEGFSLGHQILHSLSILKNNMPCYPVRG